MNLICLDPAGFLTEPGLARQAALKKTKVILNLLSDINMPLTRGRSRWGGGGGGARGRAPHFNIQPSKVQQFQFEPLGILLFTGGQKLNRSEISRFLPLMLQILHNLRRLSIFLNYIRGTDHFTFIIIVSILEPII